MGCPCIEGAEQHPCLYPQVLWQPPSWSWQAKTISRHWWMPLVGNVAPAENHCLWRLLTCTGWRTRDITNLCAPRSIPRPFLGTCYKVQQTWTPHKDQPRGSSLECISRHRSPKNSFNLMWPRVWTSESCPNTRTLRNKPSLDTLLFPSSSCRSPLLPWQQWGLCSLEKEITLSYLFIMVSANPHSNLTSLQNSCLFLFFA